MNDLFFHVFNDANFIDVKIYQYGYEKCKPAHSFGPALRQHYLFHYIISGKGKLVLENSNNTNNMYNLSSGQGFLISPNKCCHYIADEQYPWEYIWIEFSGLKIDEFIKISGLSCDNPIYKSDNKSSIELKNKMFDILNSNKDDPLEAMGHLYLFLFLLKNSNQGRMKPTCGDLKNFYVREAINYIENNYQNNITIEEISAFLGLNKSYFGKIFKEVINSNPQEFLIKYRMSKACQLLKTSNFSIKEVGEKVGYINPLHFSKIFKNTFNISPREWKIKNKYKN